MHWILIPIVVCIVLVVTVASFRRPAAANRLSRVVRSYQRNRYDLRELIRRLGLTEAEFQRISAPVWREARIPKKNGEFRVLEIPDAATLSLQRRILRRVLNRLKCHSSAIGFEKGRDIVDAAFPHTEKRVVIRVDIKRFFESTTSERVAAWFRSIGWDEEATAFLVRTVTCNGHLPQGAATSPRLSNLVNARMDRGLERLAERFRGHYTRYADDIVLSFNVRSGRRVRGILQIVRRILKQAGYRMNPRKTRIQRSHRQQKVLGLVVNQKVAIPRATRRRLRAARHHASTGRECTYSKAQLQGWYSFERMVSGDS
jgi:RNA-directed DNA polymerase